MMMMMMVITSSRKKLILICSRLEKHYHASFFFFFFAMFTITTYYIRTSLLFQPTRIFPRTENVRKVRPILASSVSFLKSTLPLMILEWSDLPYSIVTQTDHNKFITPTSHPFAVALKANSIRVCENVLCVSCLFI